VEIRDRPPGLMSRIAFDSGNKVVVDETWNIDVPGCPMIRNPWATISQPGNIYVRRMELTPEEYSNLRIPLFE
jgi:hypothetical protein